MRTNALMRALLVTALVTAPAISGTAAATAATQRPRGGLTDVRAPANTERPRGGLTDARVVADVTVAGQRPAVHGTAWNAGNPQPMPRDLVGGSLLAGQGIVVHYPSPTSPVLPPVPASAYVIANASTGAVLAAKDPHGLFPPASTLKVLTAITMLPRLRPDATELATRLAASVEPNIVGLVPGDRYKVADLFRALLLISANDAAVTLVQASGSFARGMALMNAEAHHLQAYDVVAKQPNGLPAPGQVVSAYDLALIARQALSMPAFMKYDAALTATFPITPHKHILMVNQNSLLTQYRGGLGGKIGWTVRAEATYIGLARRHGITLIVTVMHATPLTEITSAEQLLDWGFAMSGRVRPVGVLVPPLPAVPAAVNPTRSPAAAAGNSLSGATAGRSRRSIALMAALAAMACACALGSLAWLRRRRVLRGKRVQPPSGQSGRSGRDTRRSTRI
jgi:serine-type D-Ala-D-Ala carboxypeptidase (penicillin-binding protein 5/6)